MESLIFFVRVVFQCMLFTFTSIQRHRHLSILIGTIIIFMAEICKYDLSAIASTNDNVRTVLSTACRGQIAALKKPVVLLIFHLFSLQTQTLADRIKIAH